MAMILTYITTNAICAFFVFWHSLQIDEGWDLPSPNVTRFNMYFSESTLVAC